MTERPLIKIDTVLVRSGDMAGIWLRASVPLDPRQSKRMIEMVAGRERLMTHENMGYMIHTESDKMLPIKIATEEQWAHLIGLCVVEQAERLEL